MAKSLIHMDSPIPKALKLGISKCLQGMWHAVGNYSFFTFGFVWCHEQMLVGFISGSEGVCMHTFHGVVN